MKNIIPYLVDFTEPPYLITDAQAYTLAVSSYLLSIIYVLLLMLNIRNIWFILMKQERYKVIPLTAFYMITTLLCIFRIFSVIYVLEWWINMNIVGLLGPAILKLASGVIQVWITIELTMKIHLSIKVIRY